MRHKCSECDYATDRPLRLTQHLQSHHCKFADTDHHCQVITMNKQQQCGRSSSSIIQQTNSKSNCVNVSPSPVVLQRAIVLPGRSIPQDCPHCNSRHPSKAALRVHKREMHSNSQPNVLNTGQIQQRNAPKLDKNMGQDDGINAASIQHDDIQMQHETTPLNRFKCEHCRAVCKSSTGLLDHQRRYHDDIVPQNTNIRLSIRRVYKCSMCNEQCISRHFLQKHRQEKHSNIKQMHNHDSTTKRTRLDSVVQETEVNNDDDEVKIIKTVSKKGRGKPSKCDKCNETFATVVALKRHKRDKHLNDNRVASYLSKPPADPPLKYVCDIDKCPYSFHNAFTRRYHRVKVHNVAVKTRTEVNNCLS